MNQNQNQERQKNRQYFITGITTFAFLYSLKQTATYMNQKRKQKKEIKRLTGIPSRTVQEAVNEAMKSANNKCTLSFIEGMPISSGKLKSKYKTNTPLIYRLQFKKGLYSSDSFFEPAFKIEDAHLNSASIIEKEPIFNLKDASGTPMVKVYMRDETNLNQALTHLGYKDTRKSLSLPEHVGNLAFIFYTSLIKVLGPVSLVQYLCQDSSFHGVHVGFRDNEFGIRAEGFLQILGNLVYDVESKQFRIDNPFLITLSKKKTIESIQTDMSRYQIIVNLWIGVSALCGLYLARRTFLHLRSNPTLWKNIKDFFNRYLNRNNQNTQDIQQQLNSEQPAQPVP